MHGTPPTDRDHPRERPATADEAAASWLVRSHGGLSDADSRALAAWLAEDPAHGVALERLRKTWRFLDDVAPLHRRRQRRARLRRAAYAAAAAVFVATVAGGVAWWERAPPPTVASVVYQTGRGEQREVALGDGTTVWLDTGTRISVRLSASARAVSLAAGQALFDVTHDEARPFTVDTATARVRVLGTRFSVRQTPVGLVSRGTGVSVSRGHVQVTDPEGRGHVDLLAGQAAHVAPGGTPARVATAVGETWREGRVVFDDTPLADAVAELERYGDTHLVVAPSARALHITGSFSARQPEAFARAVAHILPVDLQRRGTEVTFTGRASQR
ncbi:FecR family protein [Luteibacter yeojuensis]|uniref:FecR family protein n=1 Tax=Luteibacter yeojuensis TaxID=345309 RepID=A0A0F3KUX2_9GAMM|nr:FecR domain-containing protein [Luteibacter yeojuensis]KJV34752.1 hypothetical protein VI08_09160 [Luteibacter yeojuensis]